MRVEGTFTRKPSRWIYAVLLVTVGTALGAWLLVRARPTATTREIMRADFALFIFLASVASVFVRAPKSPAQLAQDLEPKGLVVSHSYSARRTFRVMEPDDERLQHYGPHYFVELAEGGVLHLMGEYLTLYESQANDKGITFPCTEFTIRRHKWEQNVIEMVCGGKTLMPEVNARAFQEWESDQIPEDEEIIRHKTYDQLKAERLETSTASPAARSPENL